MPLQTAMANPFNFPQQELLRDGHLLSTALERMTESGQVILGRGVAGFEAAFAAWLSPELAAEQVVGVANGTDALELALAEGRHARPCVGRCLPMGLPRPGGPAPNRLRSRGAPETQVWPSP